jgi:hypothetical protein
MQRRTGFSARPAIAALALAASAIALAAPSDAAPAESCLAAPKGVAPQGRHWYYRIERSSQRKCWYLAEKGRRIAQRAETRAAPAQSQADDEGDATPAPVAAAPAAPPMATAPPSPATNVPAQPIADAPAPKITTLVTRNVSNGDQPAQSAPPAPEAAQPAPAKSAQAAAAPNSSPMIAAEAPAPAPVQAPREQEAPRAIAEQPPAPIPAAETTSTAAETTPVLQLVLGAIALFGFVASAAFFIISLLRRRNDVLNMRRQPDVLPYEHSPHMAAEDGPTFQPLRALDPIRRHDDVDEALRRVTRRRRADVTS